MSTAKGQVQGEPFLSTANHVGATSAKAWWKEVEQHGARQLHVTQPQPKPADPPFPQSGGKFFQGETYSDWQPDGSIAAGSGHVQHECRQDSGRAEEASTECTA